ncbi:PEP/pyruvate-binding domain-containing protein [Pseudonocardia sp. GCM10023141]|uniref:PEP/pyruvate-binding domain-containing protein n=1 Tax=Pseudonocardia sp. GCM10023141 TaxID=3252653 RepID=UPI003616AC25
MPDGFPVYPFDHDHGAPPRTLAELLGGKGAGLAEMTTVLGLPVPPGFTIGIPLCRDHRANGWPDGLDAVLAEQCARLGERTGSRLGDPEEPLLLAVRSGSVRSMPGMLDTVLDLGLNDVTVEALARSSADERFAWDSYRRFLRMYGTTVLGCGHDMPGLRRDGDIGSLKNEVADLKARIAEATGTPVPDDPVVQLRSAVEAVFRSWDSPRARVYRAREGIPDDLGTAVNVQAMVFGNRGADSGTGVVFSRDPSTGEPRPYGDYLPQAQGEDVVAGGARTVPVADMAASMPDTWVELRHVLHRLEVHYRDICDVEFTVERGRLYLLQTRVGKRSAVAAVRCAVAMAGEAEIALTPAEALERVPETIRLTARRSCLAEAGVAVPGTVPLTVALGASPGRVSGRAVFSSELAAEDESDDPLILVRPDTSPDDVAGMAVSIGVLTGTGGLVSHAAVVARGWGIPAVVGAAELRIGEDGAVLADGTRIEPGETITIDGTTGEVWRGDVAVADTRPEQEEEILALALPELGTLVGWAAEHAATRSASRL